jgi:iron complex outermembrane recepter protein
MKVRRNMVLFVTAAWSCDAALAEQVAPKTLAVSADAATEIVVTAQRRNENIQTVPISVTAISGPELTARGVVNTQDLTIAVPGLNFARSTTVAQPTLRGIGSRSATIGNEGNVAVYLDGVYQAQNFGNFLELNDIQQIEVLKGPQGTLYGRNALGGAIIVRTRRPEFEFQGEVNAKYGRFDERGVNAFVTGPISDKVAASLSLNASAEGGYIRNILIGGKQGERSNYTARGKLLLKASDTASIMLTAYHLQNADTSNESGQWYNGNSSQRIRPNPANIPLSVLIPTGNFETSSSIDPIDRQTATGGNLNADFELGGASLGLLGSYKQSRIRILNDATALGFQRIDTHIHARSWYGEATLTSDSTGPLSWIAGLNIFDDRGQTDPQLAIVTLQKNGVKTFAGAGFGELTYNIGKLFLTGGLRASYEKKRAFIDILAPAASVISARDSHHWSALTPRAVARYQFSRYNNIYFSYTDGFKSGSYDTSGVAGTRQSVDPEKVTAFEVGMKTRPLTNLRFNLSAYHYDYQNLQVQVIVTTPTSSSALLQNAASSKIKGLEGELQWQATPKLSLNGTFSYIDAKFGTFRNASVNNIVFVNGLPSGNSPGVLDVTGNNLIRAPKLTYSAGFDYRFDLGSSKLLLNSTVFHSSRYYTEVSNVRFQPAYTVVNGSITWRAPGDQFSLSLVGRNLTDERYVTQILTAGSGDYATFQRPRTLTVSAGYRW